MSELTLINGTLLATLTSAFFALVGLVANVWVLPRRRITAAIRQTKAWQEQEQKRLMDIQRRKEWRLRMDLVSKASLSIGRNLIETATRMGMYYRYRSEDTREKKNAQIQRMSFTWEILGWDFVVYKLRLPIGIRPHDVLHEQFVEDWRIESGRPDLQVIRTDRHGIFILVPLQGARDGVPDVYMWRDALKTLNEHLPNQSYAVPIGLSINRRFVYIDPTKDDPHALTAGVTKSGKSVMMNQIICTLISRNEPEKVQFVFIDLKFVELRPYRHLTQYLWRPIALMGSEVEKLLDELLEEMFRRLKLISSLDVRDVDEYNAVAERPEPHLFIFIDELALVVQTVEKANLKIGQLASVGRAAGLHMFLFTQRPSANIIEGPIKSNMDTRIAFKCADQAHSTTVLGNNMAVGLEPKGRCILSHGGELMSVQAPLITTPEVLRVVSRAQEQEPTPRKLSRYDVLEVAIEHGTTTIPQLYAPCQTLQPDLQPAQFLKLVRGLRYVPALRSPVWELGGERWIFSDGRAIQLEAGQPLPATVADMEQLEVLAT